MNSTDTETLPYGTAEEVCEVRNYVAYIHAVFKYNPPVEFCGTVFAMLNPNTDRVHYEVYPTSHLLTRQGRWDFFLKWL